MGGAGDSPAPVGDPPTGTAVSRVAIGVLIGSNCCARSVRRVAGRHRPVACATRTNAGFNLQSAPALTGPFTNIPAATSPYTNLLAAPQQFFRLIGN